MDLQSFFLKAYDEYADAVFRHCAFRVFDREQAADITQETFIKTWEFLRSGKKVENRKAFLFRVANNLIIDWYRKKKSISLEQAIENGFDPGFDERTRVQSGIDLKFALSYLAKLEEPYRTALHMRYVEDLSPKQISFILDESETAVSVRIHRGLKSLQNLLLSHEN